MKPDDNGIFVINYPCYGIAMEPDKGIIVLPEDGNNDTIIIPFSEMLDAARIYWPSRFRAKIAAIWQIIKA